MCLFEDHVEHRLQVAGRRVDDLQDLGSCGLLLQCLTRLGQQPCILHSDDRLRRKVLQQRDLFVGEWAYFATVNSKGPKQSAILAQRDGQVGPCARDVGQNAGSGRA